MKTKLQNICRYLESGLIEREIPARLSLLAALSGEHLLLIGQPGTAKSELARKLHHVFSQASYFERLLTRFSVPEELFGPLSIKALEQDRYHRLTDKYLPQASIAFIDEIFKANSAILNALLTLLNEREFDNGSERVKTPLICVLAASNELPEADDLMALYDRFLLRQQVTPVSDKGFEYLLELVEGTIGQVADTLDLKDVALIQQQAAGIVLSDEARQLIINLRLFLSQNEIYVSDRRWRKLIKLLRVASFTNGQEAVSPWDCSLLLHAVWVNPDQLPMLEQWFRDSYQLNYPDIMQRFEKLIVTWEQKVETDVNKCHHKTNHKGEKLYRAPDGKITTQKESTTLAERDNQILYLAPPNIRDRTNNGKGYTISELEQQFFDDHYKQTHIEGQWVDIHNYINNTQNRLVNRVKFNAEIEPYYFDADYIESALNDVAAIMREFERLRFEYANQQAELNRITRNHLWLSHGFVSASCQGIEPVLKTIDGYKQRLENVIGQLHSLAVKEAVV